MYNGDLHKFLITTVFLLTLVTLYGCGEEEQQQAVEERAQQAQQEKTEQTGEGVNESGVEEPQVVCGDGLCDPDELEAGSCPQDCGEVAQSGPSDSENGFAQETDDEPTVTCGDGLCDPDELESGSCPQDCSQ